MKKKLTSVLLFLAMSVGVVSAQTSKVTGKVVGEDGEPVIGVQCPFTPAETFVFGVDSLFLVVDGK